VLSFEHCIGLAKTGDPLSILKLMSTVPKGSSAKGRLRRRTLMAVLLGYPLHLVLLGPYHALLGTGRLDALPKYAHDTPFYPAAPIYWIPGLRQFYDGYLTFWYEDPKINMPTDW
jgi:hypothetical protein